MVKETRSDDAPFPDRVKQHETEINAIRERAAKAIRIIFLIFATMLALGAVLVAFRNNVNDTNGLVKFVKGFADLIDGPFSRDKGFFRFDGKNAVTKAAVTNWGLAAIIYVAIGRLLDRIVTPRASR